MAQLLGHLSRGLANIKFMRDHARYDGLKCKPRAHKARAEVRDMSMVSATTAARRPGSRLKRGKQIHLDSSPEQIYQRERA
jgi:hypothetical protein